MKKTLLLIAFTLATAFADPEGIFVDVELVSGTSQRAKLLGIENDTVSLGGYIQNKFTIVKIAKKQFKKIVDEHGNDLLNPPPKKKDVARQEVTASAEQSEAPKTKAVTQQEPKAEQEAKVPTKDAAKPAEVHQSEQKQVHSEAAQRKHQPEQKKKAAATNVPNKTVLVAYEANGVEQPFADQFTALTARLLMESGETPQIIRKSDIKNCSDNVCYQLELASHGFKSIYFGEFSHDIKTDSINLNLTHIFYEDTLPTLHKATLTISKESALSDAITNNKLKNQLLDAQGKETLDAKKDRSYIHIETDPDGATISRSEKDAICKSPCTFVTTDTSKFTVHAYWNVERHLWGATTNIVPIPGDTTHISLKLKRVTPEIRIQTFPEGANVYKANAPITKRTKAIAQTPEKIPAFDMGVDSLIIRKAGYRDTLINFYVAPISQIDLSINLEKLTDFDEIEKQNKWIHDKNMQTLGEAFIGGSIGTSLIGALFLYLAHLDYKDADDIKSDLKLPGSAKGENFRNKVNKNKKLVNQGDNKAIAGGILLGTAAALLGAGIYFVF